MLSLRISSSGTYTISPDCWGELTSNGANGDIAPEGSFVLGRQGTEIRIGAFDVTSTLAPIGRRLFVKSPADQCTASTLVGSFALTGGGMNEDGHPEAGVARMTFDGAGRFSVRAESIANGGGRSIKKDHVVDGGYTIAPDCTGSLTFTEDNETQPPRSLDDFVLDDDAQEIRFIRTETGRPMFGVGVK